MNWINFFESKKQPNHSFGRGINAEISEKEEELFNQSYNEFENKNIINAYEYFFNSLQNYTNHVKNNNIILKKETNKLIFTLFQGSAKITGVVTNSSFYAEVIIVKKKYADVALKRYILERNYQLTYAKYFIDNEYVKLKLFHDNITMSPQKIFFPIREIALNADFDKEHIKSEFKDIPLEDIEHIKNIDTKELQIKFDFLKLWITELDEKVLTLPSNDNAGMQAFLYLNLLFKIDYLLVPKYDIYQKASQKVREYFGEENSTIEAKNEEIKRYTHQLKDISFLEFSKNFYDAKYTFNQIDKSSYEDVINFINESLIKIRWYKNNRYSQIIPTIYRYISFYSLYNYGLNPVLKNLFQLLVEVQNSDFFSALEYKTFYNKKNESFNKRNIITKIENIIKQDQSKYQSLEAFGEELNFSGMNEFSNSFYIQLQNLNFEEI